MAIISMYSTTSSCLSIRSFTTSSITTRYYSVLYFSQRGIIMCYPGLWVGRVRVFVTFILKFVKIREFVNSCWGTGPQLQLLHEGRSPDGDFGLCTLKSTTSGLVKTSAVDYTWNGNSGLWLSPSRRYSK